MQFIILPSERQLEEKEGKSLVKAEVSELLAPQKTNSGNNWPLDRTYLDGSFPHNPGKSDSWQLGVFIS